MTNLPARPRRARGFTLVESLVALSVASVLSGIAYPSFHGSLQKSRRADALIALVQLQNAQERWRFSHRGYGALADIGVAAASPAGHYRLELVAADEDHFEVRAVAQGTQARDAACRVLSLRSDGAVTTRSSGPDAGVANAPAANRRCWSL